MKQGRRVKVPAENRRVASVVSTVVSQLKFLTLGESVNLLGDQIQVGAPPDRAQDLSDNFALNDDCLVALGLPADVFDSLSLDDRIDLQKEIRAALPGESLSLDDRIDVVKELQFEKFDSITTLADSALVLDELGHYLVDKSDSIDFSADDLAIGYGLLPAEQLTITDRIDTFGEIFLQIFGETIANLEDFAAVVPHGVDLTQPIFESLLLDDRIDLFSAGFKEFFETLTLAERFEKSGEGFKEVFDSFSGQGDRIDYLGQGFKEVFDSAIQPSDGSAICGSVWDIGVTGEQLSLSDGISTSLDSSNRPEALYDSFTLTDNIDVRRGPSRWNDAINVSTASQNNLTQDLNDSLPSMVDEQSNKFIRWRDSVSVQKVNAGALSLDLRETNTSMGEFIATSRTQIGTPVSDVSVGLWSATPLYQKIDEFPASDADLITSATNPANDTCEVGLTTSISDPVGSVSHIVSYRYAKSANAGRQIDLTVRLMQGATIIATFTHTAIGNTFTQADQTLSGAQADSITNYGDLRIRFVANAVGTGTGRAARISWAQFKCPK